MKRKPSKTMLDEPNSLLPPEFSFTFDVDFAPDRMAELQRRVEMVSKSFQAQSKAEFKVNHPNL